MNWKHLQEKMQLIKEQGRERILQDWLPDKEAGYLWSEGRRLLDLASNDYLGLARQPVDFEGARAWLSDSEYDVVADALRRSGGGASRLITGNHPVYGLLEREIAQLKGKEAALVFGSGVCANLGILPALVGKGDVIFSDELNHASLIDGMRLSRAQVVVYPHRDMQALENALQTCHASQKIIVSDALFSMDGTLAPVAELVELKKKYNAYLMLDEAHTGGVYGKEGAGWAHACGLADQVDVLMGTLSKAYGSLGGYVAGDDILIRYLTNAARTFIFTTGLPPSVVGTSLLNVRQSRTMDEQRAALHLRAAAFRLALQQAGLETAGSVSQVVPVVLGSEEKTLTAAQQLREAGYAGVAIRPPTVPQGASRIRFALGAVHSSDALSSLAKTMSSIAKNVLE